MFSDLKNHLDLRKTANVIRNITRTHKQIWNQTVQVKAGIRRKVPTGVAFLTDGRVVLQGQIISQDSDTREYRVPAGSPCLHILADLAEGAGAFNYSNFEHRLTLGEALDIGVYTRPKRNLSGMSDDN
jgi:hypothetical protein